MPPTSLRLSLINSTSNTMSHSIDLPERSSLWVRLGDPVRFGCVVTSSSRPAARLRWYLNGCPLAHNGERPLGSAIDLTSACEMETRKCLMEHRCVQLNSSNHWKFITNTSSDLNPLDHWLRRPVDVDVDTATSDSMETGLL